MTEKFFLKWNDFQSNVTTAFSQFRTNTVYQDVTLVSDDHQQISAHRVVLSACSGYFNRVLTQITNSHPFLCLDGINSFDLNNVLDYIYNGELQIFQEDLDRFLQIAQKLQLEGLLSSEELNPKIEEPTFDMPDMTQIAKPATINEKHFAVEKKPNEQNTGIRRAFNGRHTQTRKTINAEDFENIQELDLHIEQQIITTEQGHECLICNRRKNSKRDIKDHIETHINGFSIDCNLCGKTMSSRHSLRVHKSTTCPKKSVKNVVEIN